jgi:hypothetical protein
LTFALDLTKFAEKAGASADLVVKKIVLDIGSRLVYRTPVGDPTYWLSPAPPGYVGGRARGNWQYSIGEPNTSETGIIDATGENTLGGIDVVSEGAASQVHYITNTLPYIQRLEDGYSRQAPPQGIVALTVMEYQEIAGNAVSEVNQ